MPESNSPTAKPIGGILAAVPRRPVAVTMLFLAIAVFGIVSLGKLPQDLLPEISYPTLTVRTNYPGAAPEDVEERISERVQEALSTLNGLVRSSSISRAETSDVLLEFTWGTNMTFAVQEVRDRLDSVFLPDNAERPLILRYDPNLDPILRIGLRAPDGATDPRSPETLIRLRWLAEQRIKRQLETIKGVAAVQVHGGLQEEILIKVDPDRLAALGITPSLIGTRLAQENLNASAGQIREGSTDYLVRTLNEFKTVQEIAGLALEKRDNTTIRIQDVAQVERTFAEREVITRIKGSEAVEITIYREAGANIVDVAQRVREAVFGTEEQQKKGQSGAGNSQWANQRMLTHLAYTLSKEAKFELLSDQSVFIEAAVDDVRQAGTLGALFAVAVIWLFLRHLTATMIIALAIPISVIATFAPMLLTGVSLNIMSLGGLALGIGMLVDNAIVVLESITRCRDEGDDLERAAIRGTSEVAGAITASTLTTVAIFAPIVFVEGVAGQIFADQAVTVVSSLLVSLAVALLFIPMLAARPMLANAGSFERSFAWVGRSATIVREAPASAPLRLAKFVGSFLHERLGTGLRWSPIQTVPNLFTLLGRLLLVVLFLALRLVMLLALIPGLVVWLLGLVRRFTFDPLWNFLDWLYPRVLAGSLRAPWLVLGAVGLLGFGAYERVGNLGLELLPEIHQGEFTAFMTLEVGTPIGISQAIFGEIDEQVQALAGVQTTALTVGVEAETLTREIEGENTGRLTVRLATGAASEDAENRIEEQVRRIIEQTPAITKPPTFRRPTPFSLESPIAVEVRGHNLDTLAEVARDVEQRLNQLPGLTDVRSTLHPGHPEALLVFNRDKALAFGLDIGTMSSFIRDQVLGRVDTRFVEGEDRIAIRVRADQDRLATLEDVRALVINPTDANPIPLSAVAELSQVQGPAEVRRIGNNRAVLVTASATGFDLGGLTASIETALADMEVPDNVIVELGGQKRELDQSRRSLTMALLLAIFLVYVVMATQFESLLQPFIILISVPLAAIGVVYVLDAFSIPLSVVVFVGLILLAGIVVNNAIVLVDRINQRRGEGWETREAILDAGRARLRPILMTTTTTVLGLLPLTGWLAGLPILGRFGSGEGAEMRAPMAITVITGLSTSTLLTLVVVPVLYLLLVRRAPKATEAA